MSAVIFDKYEIGWYHGCQQRQPQPTPPTPQKRPKIHNHNKLDVGSEDWLTTGILANHVFQTFGKSFTHPVALLSSSYARVVFIAACHILAQT